MTAPSAAGTQRRIQALMARAWSPDAIEKASKVPAACIRRALADRGSIAPELAAAVSAAYNQLWDRQPPRATPLERSDADTHQEHAQRHGWAPPAAWDDDEIDLDDAQPADGWQRSARHTIPAAELVEDAAWVREQGGYRLASNTEVAMRLGVSRDLLEHAYHRQWDRILRSAHQRKKESCPRLTPSPASAIRSQGSGGTAPRSYEARARPTGWPGPSGWQSPSPT
jgi:hypothetical protein